MALTLVALMGASAAAGAPTPDPEPVLSRPPVECLREPMVLDDSDPGTLARSLVSQADARARHCALACVVEPRKTEDGSDERLFPRGAAQRCATEAVGPVGNRAQIPEPGTLPASAQLAVTRDGEVSATVYQELFLGGESRVTIGPGGTHATVQEGNLRCDVDAYTVPPAVEVRPCAE